MKIHKINYSPIVASSMQHFICGRGLLGISKTIKGGPLQPFNSVLEHSYKLSITEIQGGSGGHSLFLLSIFTKTPIACEVGERDGIAFRIFIGTHLHRNSLWTKCLGNFY